jgi:leucyl aminopeptidase
VTVNNPVVASAAYDPVLKAPKCSGPASGCDSGSLVNGRDGKGPEPNQPNTINNSCADSTGGTYHVDESLDRIRVVTTDGAALAAGKTVRIEATVWAFSPPTGERLDLYYTANAASPSWTFLTTLIPPGGGARTLSATYTLPSGNLQAVRAQFRFVGTASTCTVGAYNDRDDLVFTVP